MKLFNILLAMGYGILRVRGPRKNIARKAANRRIAKKLFRRLDAKLSV